MIVKFMDNDHWYLTATAHPDDWADATPVTIDDPFVTVERLADVLAHDLEAANLHNMVTIPAQLVAIMQANGVTDATIKRVLWDVLESGGWLK
jgi:hypothetical protein